MRECVTDGHSHLWSKANKRAGLLASRTIVPPLILTRLGYLNQPRLAQSSVLILKNRRQFCILFKICFFDANMQH